LFAEMVKSKTWTLGTLRKIGGAEGVGISFLEETFSASSAPSRYRFHQKSAQAVLNALLPQAGTDIKGHMRSYHDLLTLSGYAARPHQFLDLLHILDSEVRLITPTAPEDKGDQALFTVSAEVEMLSTHTRLFGPVHSRMVESKTEAVATGSGGTELG
jgi:eukaryotic-like serine/threonine-protein kinase